MQVVRMDEACFDWRPDGWQGTENFCLESSAESSDITLNSGIPDKTATIHTSDFVQTE
jgi:hypothetical protein